MINVAYPHALVKRFQKLYLERLPTGEMIKDFVERGKKLLNFERRKQDHDQEEQSGQATIITNKNQRSLIEGQGRNDQQERSRESINKWVEQFVKWHEVKTNNVNKEHGFQVSNVTNPDLLKNFVDKNVSLIKDLSDEISKEDFYKTMSDIIATNKDLNSDKLAKVIRERFKVKTSKAGLWARDQVSKLNADIDVDKYKASGIKRYVWLASNDVRTRPKHRALNGKARVVGEGLMPGDEVNCRCTMKPATDEEVMNGGLDVREQARQDTSYRRSDYNGLKRNEFKRPDDELYLASEEAWRGLRSLGDGRDGGDGSLIRQSTPPDEVKRLREKEGMEKAGSEALAKVFSRNILKKSFKGYVSYKFLSEKDLAKKEVKKEYVEVSFDEGKEQNREQRETVPIYVHAGYLKGAWDGEVLVLKDGKYFHSLEEGFLFYGGYR